MRHDFARGLNLPIERCTAKLRSANGSALPVIGMVQRLTLVLNGEEFHCSFLILEKISHDVILGNNFLSKNKASLCFNSSTPRKTSTSATAHAINTGDTMPIAVKAYRLGPHMDDIVKKHVEKLLYNRIIRPSHSPWSAPILMVPKKSGEWRMCVDFRRLNDVTIRESYPMPLIEEILDSLSGAQIFSKLDVNLAFTKLIWHLTTLTRPRFLAS